MYAFRRRFTALHGALPRVLLLFLLPLLSACGGNSLSSELPELLNGGQTEVAPTPPPITLRFVGSGVPREEDLALMAEFTESTGIGVQYVRGPDQEEERLALYAQFLTAESADVDLFLISPVMVPSLASHLLNLRPHFTDGELSPFFPLLLKPNMHQRELVAIPWFVNTGLLLYRTDLLRKYGIDAPPQTWDELVQMATLVQQGEAESNPNLWGFVWQGANQPELLENGLEWQAAHGGSGILGKEGDVQVNSPQTVQALEKAAGWIGTISPLGVTGYTVDNSLAAWWSGNVLFLRIRPQSRLVSPIPDSPVTGNFAISALPYREDPQASVPAVIGGGALAVNRHSAHVDAAVLFIKYVTSPENQRQFFNGDESRLPTVIDLYTDSLFLAAYPYLAQLRTVLAEGAIIPPYRAGGEHYRPMRDVYVAEVHRVLTGQQTGEQAAAAIERQIQALLAEAQE